MGPGLVGRSLLEYGDRAGHVPLPTPDWKPRHGCQRGHVCWQLRGTAGLEPRPRSRIVPKKVQMRTRQNAQRGEPSTQLHSSTSRGVFRPQKLLFLLRRSISLFIHEGMEWYLVPIFLVSLVGKPGIPLVVQDLTISAYLAPCLKRPFPDQLHSRPQWHPVGGTCFESRYLLCTFAKLKSDCAVHLNIQNT